MNRRTYELTQTLQVVEEKTASNLGRECSARSLASLLGGHELEFRSGHWMDTGDNPFNFNLMFVLLIYEVISMIPIRVLNYQK